MFTGRALRSIAAGLFAAACGAFFAGPAYASINLNGGFEIGTGADAANWGEFYSGGGPLTVAARDNTNPASGSWAMLLKLGGTEASGSHAEAQSLTPTNSIIPGGFYDFSFQAKRVGPVGVSVVSFYRVQWLDSDGSHGGGVKGTTPQVQFQGSLTESYQTYAQLNQVAPAGADAALIQIWTDGGAMLNASMNLYIDNVVLTPEPASLSLLAAGAALVLRRRRAA